MRKIFFAMVLALVLSVQNFCAAAVTIDKAQFSTNENLIYPVVHTGNAAIDKKINTEIIAEVDRFVTGVQKNAVTNNFLLADIRSNYTVGSNQAGNTVILSIVLTESWYYQGAAHPATVMHALNFNTSSGALMDVSYLTDVGSGVSKDELLRRVERALVKHCQQNGLTLFDNALPLKKLPDEFYWDENLKVHFIFQHYEVAPYAAGIIDVKLDD